MSVQPSTSKDEEKDFQGFGTFKGVFIPSLLSVLGVVMYLRLGWVVGQTGLFGTLAIVTLASSVTFITGLSISMTATNMKVRGGGAYYMISRSLGLEVGTAVGLPLYLAQTLGIAFYLAGFAESIAQLFPFIQPITISLVGLVILTLLAYFSADVALRMQTVILIIIVLSLISFFIGEPVSPTPKPIGETERLGFWAVFAVFFPAVTGIEAGIAMSGNLKNPAKSLPVGTIGAILVSYVIYLAIPWYLYGRVPPEVLRQDTLIMAHTAKFEKIVILAIWGASLSSALGALLGAPRTLQALARDSVLPRFLGRGQGKDDAPRIATAVTFIVALIGILLGDLNAIAPVLSMFFLTSYGILNLSAGVEGLIANPSWRPRFRMPFSLSLFGTLLCFSIMFMINSGATIIAIFLSISIFIFMQKRGIRTHFDDLRVGILGWLARFSIYRLDRLPKSARSWRPHCLVLSGSPTSRWYLIDLAHAMTHGKGFLTLATILPKGQGEKRRLSMQKTIRDFLDKRNVEAMVHVSHSAGVFSGVKDMVQSLGIGPLVPNTVMLGETEKENNFVDFAQLVIELHFASRNLLIVRQGESRNVDLSGRKIDVWWGRERQNAALALTLGYMLQASKGWKSSQLHLRTIVGKEEDIDSTQKFLRDFTRQGRIESGCHVYASAGERSNAFALIREKSKSSDLVFLGLKMPSQQEWEENREKAIVEFSQYYQNILKLTQSMPLTVLVVASEDLKFQHILRPD